MPDDLGTRMKAWENVWRSYLPPRMPIIARIDGKAFHGFVKKAKCQQPFDESLMTSMDFTAYHLMWRTQGCILAYTQSDEISLLIQTDKTFETQAPFGGNIQKLCSVLASTTTAHFNSHFDIHNSMPHALFDARVFTLTWEEVPNYFLWRFRDCEKNSINSYARSILSHKQCINKGVGELYEELKKLGHDWHTLNGRTKHGKFVADNNDSVLNNEDFYKYINYVNLKSWIDELRRLEDVG